MAQIVLVTGKPRIGKTAFVVDMLLHEEDYKERKLFSNINGLKLPHHQPPEGHSWEDMHIWLQWEENIGSLVVYDEVQNLFPTRSNGSRMPENVAFLNVHGHYGIDMILITQSPKIIDVNLREVVNKHIHITANMMGGLTRLEWNEAVSNPTSSTYTRKALSTVHKVNEAVFDVYESAKVHSNNKKVRSRWYYVLMLSPVFLLLSFGLVGYIAYGYYQDFQRKSGNVDAGETPLAEAAASDAVAGNLANVLTGAVLPPGQLPGAGAGQDLSPAMFVPTLSERPESKPIYNAVRQVHSYERVAACIKGGKTGCTCYSDQATPLREISPELCEDYAENGLPFDPFRQPRQDNPSSVSADSAPSAGPQVSVLGGEAKQNLAYSADAPRSAQ